MFDQEIAFFIFNNGEPQFNWAWAKMYEKLTNIPMDNDSSALTIV